MTSIPKLAQRSYLALAQCYRNRARQALAQARNARWVGREWAVADLVQDALLSRRTANHFATLARPLRPGAHRLGTRGPQPEQLRLPFEQ
jgi:hypothetical protein